MPLGFFYGVQRFVQLHTGIAEHHVKVFRRQCLSNQVQQQQAVFAAAKGYHERISFCGIFDICFLDKSDCPLLHTGQQSCVFFPQILNGNGCQGQSFPVNFDFRLGVVTALFRLCNNFSVYYIAPDSLRPKQRFVCVRVIPVGVHSKKVKFFLKNGADFLFYMCINRQTKNTIAFCPFVAVHDSFLYSFYSYRIVSHSCTLLRHGRSKCNARWQFGQT